MEVGVVLISNQGKALLRRRQNCKGDINVQ
jgi:hypothetical protein